MEIHIRSHPDNIYWKYRDSLEISCSCNYRCRHGCQHGSPNDCGHGCSTSTFTCRNIPTVTYHSTVTSSCNYICRTYIPHHTCNCTCNQVKHSCSHCNLDNRVKVAEVITKPHVCRGQITGTTCENLEKFRTYFVPNSSSNPTTGTCGVFICKCGVSCSGTGTSQKYYSGENACHHEIRRATSPGEPDCTRGV